MEVAGLAIGIAGLAGLFSTCLDALEKVDAFRDFGVEYRMLRSQFQADKLLFHRWCENVGFRHGRIDPDHHKDLDDPAIRQVVEEILISIRDLSGAGIDSSDEKGFEKVSGAYLWDQGAPSSHPSVTHTNGQLVSQSRFTKSTKERISWALKGKNKAIFQVQAFSSLLQKLQDIIPPGDQSSLNIANREGRRCDTSFYGNILTRIE